MADKRITALTELAYADMANADALAVEDISAGNTKKVTLESTKKFALENRTIAGTTAGSIATIDGTQTLTNKTLTTPNVNEAVALTSTSTELNKLDGCTATTAELNLTHTYAAKIPYLANVTSDIQGQINALGIDPLYMTHSYGLTFTASGTTKDITEDDVLNALGFSTSAYYIDPTSMHGTIATVTGGTYSVIDDTGAAPPNVQITWTTRTDTGQIHLDTLKASGLTNGNQYNIAFSFKLLAISGV